MLSELTYDDVEKDLVIGAKAVTFKLMGRWVVEPWII